MTIEILKSFFMWSLVLNYSILLLWLVLIGFARNFFHRIQSLAFPISQEKLIAYNYLMYGIFKLAIIVFNLVPFIVLSILY